MWCGEGGILGKSWKLFYTKFGEAWNVITVMGVTWKRVIKVKNVRKYSET